MLEECGEYERFEGASRSCLHPAGTLCAVQCLDYVQSTMFSRFEQCSLSLQTPPCQAPTAVAAIAGYGDNAPTELITLADLHKVCRGRAAP